MMREMFEHCQIYRYVFALTWYHLPPPIVIFSQCVIRQPGHVFNGYGIHV